MNTTTNLGLKKPQKAAGDPIDIDVLNDNSDIIDNFAGETDTALASKQDALSQAQLAAVNSGITAAKLTADEAALVELVDGGAKNLAEIMLDTGTFYNITFAVDRDAGTITVSTNGNPASAYKGFRFLGDADNTGWAYGVPIPQGTYVVRGINPTMSQTGMRYILGTTSSAESARTTVQIWDDYEFTVSNDTTRIDMSLYIPSGWNSTVPQICKPVICDKRLWTVSQSLTPYAPTNHELYMMLLALQNGTRSAPALAMAEPEEVEPETGEEGKEER